MINSLISRGEVWFIVLDPTVGHEQAKIRPCLVVSADDYNHGFSGLIVIVPITGTYRAIPWFVELLPPEGGLKKRSYAICDQVRTVSLQRFKGKRLGVVSSKTLKNVELNLYRLFDLY